MVITSKADGSPRRTVDLSPLNTFCLRETHHVQPPFKQAKKVPSNSWKSVTDVWNGYHSVPIRSQDRHYTTFITPWGRYRYRGAPQGFLASGDAYSRRFDEIIADIERKTKCVDDTLTWDEDLTEHWWRMIDFLSLLGNNGVILNRDKFQFAKRTVDFAGFQISEHSIKPAQKFVDAILQFPTPTKLTDVRSWFGLVNQVSHYDQLSDIMEPFKRLLSAKTKFEWTADLDIAFQKSKDHVVNSIVKGVEIFDPQRYTCLRPDWSKTGIGFFLSQKHCSCPQLSPDCCDGGWRITLAGSRFLRPAERRYAPVEGEALAIAWSLEQTRYFTQGCDRLVVVTDHKPLLKLFGDRTLDEIANPRLFRLKQRTLLWRFTILHAPGKTNFSDATSRKPARADYGCQPSDDNMETEILQISANNLNDFRAITWEIVKRATDSDRDCQDLIHYIKTTFPSSQALISANVSSFWKQCEQLHTVDGVIMMGNRIVIPEPLRSEVLQSLHAAHQGVTAMKDRARCSVYWPGISKDIELTREACFQCNRCAPSQPKLPPFEPHIPTTPFEAVCSDYFFYKTHYYFICADRLSGWTAQQQIRPGGCNSGAQGLLTALRQQFATFGVPVEITSDGGPEFASSETKAFLSKWGVRHRLSSSYLPSSNGRTELAVKAVKRLLMDNVDSQGRLDTDRMVRALLVKRNTPDPGCLLSPSEVLFGHKLRDTLPCIKKDHDIFHNEQISAQWREAWQLKEESLRVRYAKTLEKLGEHTRQLPPLEVGDQVLLQNQSGLHPNRWDRSGVVVEALDYDQYRVKVAGTGRITLRNRRFLRKYQPHLLHRTTNDTTYCGIPPSTDTTPDVTSRSPDGAGLQPQPIVNAAHPTLRSNQLDFSVLKPQSNADASPSGLPRQTSSKRAIILDSCARNRPGTSETPTGQPDEGSTLLTPPVELDVASSPTTRCFPSSTATDDEKQQPRQSTRLRFATKLYDAETGKYTLPRE